MCLHNNTKDIIAPIYNISSLFKYKYLYNLACYTCIKLFNSVHFTKLIVIFNSISIVEIRFNLSENSIKYFFILTSFSWGCLWFKFSSISIKSIIFTCATWFFCFGGWISLFIGFVFVFAFLIFFANHSRFLNLFSLLFKFFPFIFRFG